MFYRWRRGGHSATRMAIDDPNLPSEQERVLRLLRARGLSRATDFARLGIFPATLARMLRRGMIVRPAHGLYDLPGGCEDANDLLVAALQQVPDAVVCMVSALVFHDVLRTRPASVWLALDATRRAPVIRCPRVQFVHFGEDWLRTAVERHLINGVPIEVYAPAKTIVDLFRYPRMAGGRVRGRQGLAVARMALCEVLRQNRATPDEITGLAAQAGLSSVIEPHLEQAITSSNADDA